MSTYLVTGGAGFIGSHLVDLLLKRGHEVIVLDNLSTGRAENVATKANLIIGDIRVQETVQSAMQGVDGVFHLAAVASVEASTKNWYDSHTTNLSGSVIIFETAKAIDTGPVRVVYASSAAVYGDNTNTPLAETEMPRPLTAYGADKLGCEQHARSGEVVHNMSTVGTRFFNVYGPRQDPKSPYSGVISIFAERMLRGDPVVINGDGQQTRDFIFVGDVCETLYAAMQSEHTGADVVNVCTGRETTIADLANELWEQTGKKSEISNGAARPGDIRRSIGNPSRMNERFGVVANTVLSEGLAETLAWVSECAKAEDDNNEHDTSDADGPSEDPNAKSPNLDRKGAVSRRGVLTASSLLAAAALLTPRRAQGKTAKLKNSTVSRRLPSTGSWAAFYGATAAMKDLSAFDVLALDPKFQGHLAPLNATGTITLGYISLGEIASSHDAYERAVKTGALVEENINWKGSYIVDVRSEAWRKFVVEDVAASVKAQGFKGFFLDTLDSAIGLEQRDPDAYAGMTDACVTLVRELRAAYPDAPLLMNRAYVLLDDVQADIDGVLAESLVGTYDFATEEYREVPSHDTSAQLTALKAARDATPALPVYSLDYWDQADQDGVKAIYERERAMGHVPYVSTILLDGVFPERTA